jgi:hypothetical protein
MTTSKRYSSLWQSSRVKISKYEYKVSRSEDEKEYATPFIDNIQGFVRLHYIPVHLLLLQSPLLTFARFFIIPYVI